MPPFGRNLAVPIAAIAIAVVLMAIPPDPNERSIVERESVSVMEGVGQTTSLSDGSGSYEVWATEREPGVSDYEFLFFEVETDGETVEVVRGDGTVTQDIDGVPYELFCTFETTGRSPSSYSLGTVEPGHDGEGFELVFMRYERRGDLATFWTGIALAVAGAVWLLVMLVVRRGSRPQGWA